LLVVSEFLWSSSLTQYSWIGFFGRSQPNIMSLYYSLSREISGEKLVQDISKLVNKFIQNGGDGNNSILVVEIHRVSDHSGDSLLPKLTHDCPT
jgi:hypothetical protein